MKKILVCNNTWDNIGNAFFKNSLITDLTTVFEGQAKVMSCDFHVIPVHRPFFRNTKVLDLGLHLCGDLVVFSGPRMSRRFPEVSGPAIRALAERGVKYALMSLGSHEYDDDEVKICRRFLKDYPPYVLTSRDSETYEKYHDLATYSYDGICSAFYSPLHYEGYDTPGLGKYIVMGFEQTEEPTLRIRSNFDDKDIRTVDISSIEIASGYLRKLSKYGVLAEAFKKYPGAFGGYEIVRPLHYPMARFLPVFYSRTNRYVSINPYGYLNLYRNASLVLSERVHACVIALSYGVPAMLFTRTKRDALFRRIGVDNLYDKPVTLPAGLIEKEHDKFIGFLKQIVI